MRGANHGGSVVSESGSLEAAQRRLSAALDALDAALERRQEADGRAAALVAQAAALSADRAQLAAALDRETARAGRLETAGRGATERIDRAMDAVRAAMGGDADATPPAPPDTPAGADEGRPS